MSKKNADFDDGFFSEEVGEGGNEREPLAPEPPGKAKASPSRLLLLLLLLVVASAGGYFFLLSPTEEPPPAPSAAVRKAIPMPVKTPISADESQATVSVAAPTASAVAPAEVAHKEVAPPAVSAPEAAKPVAAQATSMAEAPQEKAAAGQNKMPPAAAGKFEVEVGAFLFKANRQAAEKAVRQLGFEPKTISVSRPVEMIRLRLSGTYSPMDAEAKLQELAAITPDAFAVPQGEQMSLYAGSYYLLDQARVFADQLYGKGIEVEEEKAKVVMPLQVISFGSFADQAAATAAIGKLKKAGFEPVMVTLK